ncbi:MAG: alpha-xylosidase, partial [Calditrichaeota bacterium]
PPGKWIDYQSGQIFPGRQWHRLQCGELPGILLVKNNTAIPHITPAISTDFLDWGKIEWKIYSDSKNTIEGFLYSPKNQKFEKHKIK